MKYEATTKRVRNELLYEYWLHHPELSLEEIGKLDVFRITKQRVSKIIQREIRREIKDKELSEKGRV